MKENDIKEVIENIVSSVNMSDLELYQFELKDRNSAFELFFDHYFRSVEGFPCSHDKSAYVVRKISDYLLNGKNYSLQETYEEYQKRGGDIGGITNLAKVCYWCPKTLKDTEEATKLIFHYLCMDMNFFKTFLTDRLGG